jgi:DNA (cytosine-5)-methyltransferase 1
MARMREPMKILDLCCGHGLAAIGYHQIFKHAKITGVDVIDMSSSYPFNFIQSDAFSLDYEFISAFDLIHMSPPCQRYSKITPKRTRDNHPHLIPSALRLGYASGKPFVVENVPGSTQWLRPTCKLTVGGKERYFHANFEIEDRRWRGVDIMSNRYHSKRETFMSWGFDHDYGLGMRDLRQGIPPKMTMHIAMEFMAHKVSTWYS